MGFRITSLFKRVLQRRCLLLDKLSSGTLQETYERFKQTNQWKLGKGSSLVYFWFEIQVQDTPSQLLERKFEWWRRGRTERGKKTEFRNWIIERH